MKQIALLLLLSASAFAQRQNPLWTIVGAGASVPGSCSGHTIFIYTTDGSYRYCNGSSFVNPFSGMVMTYPGTGVANSTGSAWGTSYTVGTGANNLVQLNGSSQLPAVSAALLTNFPTLNQNTSGTAANLSGTPALPNGTTVTTQTQGDNSTKAASTAYTDTGLATKAASTAATTVNGQSCALSNTCTVTAAPSGSASGDLSGSYPSPTVSRIHDALTAVNNAASPYTVVSTDSYIACDATAGAVVLNLPAATATGREISVKKIDSSSNACTPTRAGSDLIDGATSYSLTTQYAASKIVDQASGVWARSHVNQLGGDVTGVSTANTVKSLNGTLLSGLATGIVKITTGTGVPSIAIAADFPTLNQNTTGNAATVTNLTLANTLTTSGNFPLTLTTTASTNLTLPTSGTLVNTAVSTLSSLASVGTITTGTWQATKLGLAYGGTNADLSGTGGTSQVLKQTSVGGAVTVGQLACADLSNSASGCSNAAGVTTTSPLSGTTALSLLVNVDFAFTHSQTVTVNGIAATSTDGLLLTNTTAAAAGAQQWSPRLHLVGQGWKTTATAASQTIDAIAELQPVQGSANPSGRLTFSTQVNGAGYSPGLTILTTGSAATPGNEPAVLSSSSGARGFWSGVSGFFVSGVNAPATDGGDILGAGLQLRGSHVVSWATGTDPAGSQDTGVCRGSGGQLNINDGSATCTNYRDLKSRHNLSAGTAPSITSGFGTSPSIAGGDESITITVGSGGTAATGVVTFGTAYTNAPNCVAGDNTTLVLTRAATTTTTVTIDSGGVAWTAADKISVVCKGY